MDNRQSAYKRANIGQVLGSFNSMCHIVIHKLLDQDPSKCSWFVSTFSTDWQTGEYRFISRWELKKE